MSDLVIIAMYLGAASGIFLLGALLRPWFERLAKRYGLAMDGVESARKLAHVLCACFIATLPFSGGTYRAGIAIGVIVLGALYLIRRPSGGPLDYLFCRRGGSMAFAVAVIIMSLITYDKPQVFAVSFIILGFADPAAAWAGMTFRGPPMLRKSRIGFFAHFTVALVILLGFFTGILGLGWGASALAAGGLATVLSYIEGISGGGYDNLTVPLSASVGLNLLLHSLG